MELKFRDLRANEIECRVGNIIKTDRFDGFTLLLYKNARVDMQLLDEVVGVGNWQREHIILGNDIYCVVSVWNDELKQWIKRSDAGASGSIEEEKSKASDSFKRACVNFGLGRCLYTAPSILISTTEDNRPKGCKFVVKEIAYKNHEIIKLVIINEKTKKVVYSFGSDEKVETNQNTSQNAQNQPKSTIGSGKGTIRDTEKALIKAMLESKTIDECNGFYNWLDKHFGTMNYEMLSDEQGVMVCKRYKLM